MIEPAEPFASFHRSRCRDNTVCRRMRFEMSDIEQLGHEPAAGPDYAAAQRLAAIVESSDDAIISKNLGGIVLTWNQSAERIFGYRADEAIGKPITIVIPPEL